MISPDAFGGLSFRIAAIMIKIVIKVTSDMKLMDELMFYVNDELIDTSKYKIEYIENKYVLTYKIADPNWTPYY